MSTLLEALRAQDPDGLAIDGARRLTRGELIVAVEARAAELRSAAAGRPVAVRLDHGADLCIAELALFEAGLAGVVLPPFFTAAQAEGAMAAAGCALELTADGAQRVDRASAPLPAGTARVTFTSGSTGAPKGVCLSEAHLVNVAGAVAEALSGHAGRHLPLLPPGVLLEAVAGFYTLLVAGGAYVALSQAEVGLADPFRPDWPRMLAAIETQRITSLILVPEYLAGLVAAIERTGMRLPSLTLVAVGGARTAPSLLARAGAVGLPVRQGYGLTECGSVVSLEPAPGAGGVGQSLGAHKIRIADDGEILIDGPLFLGTIGQPREPGPYATGDIGRLDADGNLHIDGRKSSLIVTAFGRNISPEWVEGALVEQPDILQACVRGEGAAALEALIVPARPDADIDAAVVAANATLPAYARVGRVRVVPPFLPQNGQLTANGRLRRAAIALAYPEADTLMPFFDRLVADTREAQARFAIIPQLQAGLTGRITRAVYLDYLTQAYHHVRHTVPLMQAARARLSHRPELVAALDEYIAEETGHEEWILDDIAAAGGDRAAAAASTPGPAAAAMVAHAYHVIATGNPAAFFGMVYVLEGTSILMAQSGAKAVQASLGLPPQAFRYLTSHGALDQQHMTFFERLMNRIDDPGDQQAIVRMANEMFALFGGIFAGIDLEAPRAAA